MDDLKAGRDGTPRKKSPMHFSRLRVIKNAVVLGSVFFITFTAYDCLSMLQSTLNHEGGIGVICQSIVYACFCISSLLLPKYVIKKLGCKVTLVLSMCLYLPYVASNLYPHWALMVPAAVVNGSMASLLWGSQAIYLNEMAAMHASKKTTKGGDDKQKFDKKIYVIGNADASSGDRGCTEKKIVPVISLNDVPQCSTSEQCEESRHDTKISPPLPGRKRTGEKNVEATTAKFFGIFGMAYLSTHMWSNLMSYFVLERDALRSNSTLNSTCVCGAQYCNVKSECFIKNLQVPSIENREFLTGLCLSMGAVSILILVFLLDPLNDQVKEVEFSVELILATFRQSKKKKQALLIPLSFYVGMIQGFYTGDFNVSFVGCAWGTYHVGLVSVCYGAMCAVASFSGTLVAKVGRIPVFTLAALMNVTAHILLLTWTPDAENPALFFVIAGLWGTAVGVFWSQSRAMYGFLFKKDEEAAFAAYHLWYSLGFCVSFAYSNHLCTYIKIYISLSLLVVGMVGYLCVEVSIRRKIK